MARLCRHGYGTPPHDERYPVCPHGCTADHDVDFVNEILDALRLYRAGLDAAIPDPEQRTAALTALDEITTNIAQLAQ